MPSHNKPYYFIRRRVARQARRSTRANRASIGIDKEMGLGLLLLLFIWFIPYKLISMLLRLLQWRGNAPEVIAMVGDVVLPIAIFLFFCFCYANYTSNLPVVITSSSY